MYGCLVNLIETNKGICILKLEYIK